MLVLGVTHIVVRSCAPAAVHDDEAIMHVSMDEDTFRDALLLGHHDVLSSVTLLAALRERWVMAESASRELAWRTRTLIPNQYPTWKPSTDTPYARDPVDWQQVAKIRCGVMLTLQRWLQLFPGEFVADPVLFEATFAFLNTAVDECDAGPVDVPTLVRTVAQMLDEFPMITMRTVARYGSDLGRDVYDARQHAFDWDRGVGDLFAYLESVVTPLYGALAESDFARAASALAHLSPHLWHTACRSLAQEGGAQLTLARLFRHLPAPNCASSDAVCLVDSLPHTLRTLCEAYETVAHWVEGQVAEVHLGLPMRTRRITMLLEVVGMARAQMARDLRGSPHAALPRSFLETAVLDGLLSSPSLAHHGAWTMAVEQRAGTALAEAIPTCVPPRTNAVLDPFWMLAALATVSMRRPVPWLYQHERVPFSASMLIMELVRAAMSLRAAASPSALPTAYARLASLRAAAEGRTWPMDQVQDEAVREGRSAASPPRWLASLCAEREAKATAMAACKVPEPAASAPPPLAMPAQPPLPADVVDERAVLKPAPRTPSRADALLAAVPMARVASTLPCAGALLRVWPYERHPYVFELVLPNSTRCALKVPDFASFCQWLAKLQEVTHIRLDTAFDAGEYAAQVAEHQGRQRTEALFQVGLRELRLSSGMALPRAIELMLYEVEARGLNEQGIYRISGRKQAVESLLQLLRTHPADAISFGRIDVHVIASTIKLWLRELPEPLVPYAFYYRLVDTEEINDPVKRVRAISRLVRAFPRSHYYALERIVGHLAMVAHASKVNLMAPHNIGLVFGSTLLSPPPGAGSVSEGLQRLGKAAHIVKILVVMHRHIFPSHAARAPDLH